MLGLPKRFIEIIQDHGMKEAWKRSKTYFLFRLPDPYFWHPLTRFVSSRFDDIDRDELREQSVIEIETETEFIPYKSILGVPTREDDNFFYSYEERFLSAEIPFGEDQAFYKPGSRFVTVIENAKVRGLYGFFTDPENRIIHEANGPENLQPGSTNGVLKRAIKELKFAFNEDSGNRMSKVAPLTISHGDAYYHWTIESLCKIFMLEKYGDEVGEYPDLLVREDRKEFMDETLDIINYQGDVRYWSGRISEIEKLVVPTYPDPVVGELEWLRNRMIENAENLDIGSKKILVTRQDAETRQIENFEEVEDELVNLGFEIVTPGEHTVEEQINIFKDAETIVGVHGAGLTNIIYSEDAHVVELVGENKNHASFSRICYVLNHKYSRIRCKNKQKHVNVPLNKIKNVIEGEK